MRARRCASPTPRWWSSTPSRASKSRRRKIWAAAEELDVPRIVVLNRLDRERASLERSLESLRAVFGRAVVPLQLPIGEEKAFRGVVDLVAMKAWMFAADGSGKPSESADSSPSSKDRRRRRAKR